MRFLQYSAPPVTSKNLSSHHPLFALLFYMFEWHCSKLVTLLLLVDLLSDANGLLNVQSNQGQRTITITAISSGGGPGQIRLGRLSATAQGRGQYGGSGNSKNKKKDGPTFGGKIPKTRKNDKRTMDSTANGSRKNEQQWTKATLKNAKSNNSNNNGIVLPSTKSNGPPWQVLNSKEIKNNLDMETKRRELAKQGIRDNGEADSTKSTANDMNSSSKTATASPKMLSQRLLSPVDQQLIQWKRFKPSSSSSSGGLMFIGAYLDQRVPPRMGVPEIAFLGRSNVGKSSLLNKLVSTTLEGGTANARARVGKTPGATASVNLYAMMGRGKKNMNGSTMTTATATATNAKPLLGLVDLPGFGYAKLSKEVQESVQLAAERYLDNRMELALGILLVDARRVPSDDDRAVLAALFDLGIPLVVVATKIDKLTSQELEVSKQTICDRLGLPPGQPLCVSSVTGDGIKELWKIIMEACETRVDEIKDQLQCSSGDRNDDDDDETDTDGITDFDEFGNLMLPYDDGEELAYSQGYDWIQDTAVMYPYSAGETNDRELGEDDDDAGILSSDDENDRVGRWNQVQLSTNSERVSFKSLTKMARQMEERGEV